MRDVFERTTRITHHKVFGSKQPPKMALSILEAVLIGVSLNLDSLDRAPAAQVSEAFDAMLRSQVFAEENLSRDLASRARVVSRVEAAKAAFEIG